MKDILIQFLQENIETKLDYEKLLEKPKHSSHGDFSFPCFLLAKELKQAPPQIAKQLEEQFNQKLPETISKVVATGPFLNFYLNSEIETKEVFDKFEDETILNFQTEQPQKILIEYPSPNTNKSLHVGHTRNMLLGSSLARISSKVGHKVITTNLNNDRGIAICKSMISYELFGNNQTPQDLNMKPDEFASHWYVEYGKQNKAKPELNLDEKSQEMLVKWEAGDKEVRALWQKLQDWVHEGYSQTFKNYHLGNFDQVYFESQIYDKAKDIVLKAYEDKVKGFEKEEDGAIFVDLEDMGYGKKYLLRGDETTMYMTQDLYLASLKEKQFHADKSIFVVGQEQEYHFKVLFEVLSRLGYGNVESNYHFAYGYVYNENGKKFSSRLGDTLGADDILDQMKEKAKENLLAKELTQNLDESELEKRAEAIGFGALSFTFLKPNPVSAINFSLDQALSFEGETGPYVQYTYARIKSILRKQNYEKNTNINYSLFEEKELALVKLFKEYSKVLEEASSRYKISAIANYLIKVSQAFNEFYQVCPIAKADSEELKQARLLLALNTSILIKDGLSLLGIDTLEEM